MNQEDQRYALMAAAAAAAYAQKKARDEARRAMIISTALNQNMSSLDPKTQEDLQQLLQAEARRVRQENFEWKVGLWIGGIVVGGFILFFLMVVGIGSCSSHSYGSSPTSSSYVAARSYATPEPTPRSGPEQVFMTDGTTIWLVRNQAEYDKLSNGSEFVWQNGKHGTKTVRRAGQNPDGSWSYVDQDGRIQGIARLNSQGGWTFYDRQGNVVTSL